MSRNTWLDNEDSTDNFCFTDFDPDLYPDTTTCEMDDDPYFSRRDGLRDKTDSRYWDDPDPDFCPDATPEEISHGFSRGQDVIPRKSTKP